MADFDPAVAQVLTALIANLKEVSPEMADILDKAKHGEIDETTAMSWLLETVKGNPALAAKVQTLTRDALAPLNQADAPAQGLFVPRGGTGFPRLNPLYEAALVERAQFDGDIPEFRTGDIADGAMPAVPVKTKARNPVAIGLMVQKAAKQVKRDLTRRTQERKQLAEAAAAGDPNALAMIQQHGNALAPKDGTDIIQGNAQGDPEKYRRGEVPQLQVAHRPTASILAKMTETERRQAAWQFLSTTQGRRSAVTTIRGLVAAYLNNKGLKVAERDFNPQATRVQPLAYKEWSLTLSGAGMVQPAFALVDTAARVLANGLFGIVTEGTTAWLEVLPVDEVDNRKVGWAARLIPRDP